MPFPVRLPGRLALCAMLLLAISGCTDQRDTIAGIPSGAANGLYPQLILSGTSSASTEVRVSLLSKPQPPI